MKFVAASIVLAATISVALADAAAGYNVPYGYRLVPINSGYYPYAYPAAIPAPLPAARFAAPLPAAFPAPIALAPAPAAAQYKTESFATPYGSKSEIRDDAGQYSLSYTTKEGTQHSERSYLKPGPEGNVPVIEGSYRYTSPEGIPVSYEYKADENGYTVKGFPLPEAPAPLKA